MEWLTASVCVPTTPHPEPLGFGHWGNKQLKIILPLIRATFIYLHSTCFIYFKSTNSPMCRNMEIPSFPALAREETRFSNYQLDDNPNPRQPKYFGSSFEVNPTLNYKRDKLVYKRLYIKVSIL